MSLAWLAGSLEASAQHPQHAFQAELPSCFRVRSPVLGLVYLCIRLACVLSWVVYRVCSWANFAG